MSTELALKEAANNPVALNKLFGFEGRPKPQIPYLKINGSDDEDGTKAPKGTFVYDDGDRVLYAPEATIRSFVKAYQYRLYDAKDPGKNDHSIIARSFKEEFRSVSGRIACGKMNKKAYAQLGDNVSSIQKYLQDTVKCKLLVFGLVSGEFTDLDTKKPVVLKDALFVWTVSQSGFMSVDQAITGIEKERRAVALTPISIKLKKEKQGSVTYFAPIPEVLNKSEALEVKRDEGYLNEIKKFIVSNNEYVNDKYNEALKGAANSNNFAKTAKVVEKDALDFDELPF